ncbi:TetR/AcrR family transcriptional regulator [Nocardioides sp. C4-1]|uniref:TetR/AcrR family transcriptional regulator n=1 Tax=Nocardioides sp. C4-1 TaxID=3151851 RepID=UPI003264555E
MTASTPAPETDGRRRAAAVRRRAREAQIIEATRAAFDRQGIGEMRIEDIAAAVGVNRAIIYRVFTGKEELFALTLVSYLDEMRAALEAAASATEVPADRLAAIVGAFVDYGVRYPAFVDCAQALMRRRGEDLLLEISESALFRLGRAISANLNILTAALEGLGTPDPVLTANTLYASGLGALQLARLGILVTELAPGVPTVGTISPDQVRSHLVSSALALAGAH